MVPKIALALSTIALGTALAAVPTFAQTSNGPDNSAQQFKYPVGRAVNDGGPGYDPQSTADSGPRTGTAADQRRSGKITDRYSAQNSPAQSNTAQAPIGRAVNDGGPGYDPQNSSMSGGPTGSAANPPAARAGTDTYAANNPGWNGNDYYNDNPSWSGSGYYNNNPGWVGGGYYNYSPGWS